MAENQHSEADPELQPTIGAGEEAVRRALIGALRQAVSGGSRRRTRPNVTTPKSAEVVEKPINFNAAMVRALLAGHKTQTRRPVRPLPVGQVEERGTIRPAGAKGEPMQCRLASPGMRLWVREPWQQAGGGHRFEADVGPAAARRATWRPGRFLARHASRLTLLVTEVRPERLNAITATDAAAEGMPPGLFTAEETAVAWFHRLWDTFYGGGEFAWKHDPWVWVINFRVET